MPYIDPRSHRAPDCHCQHRHWRRLSAVALAQLILQIRCSAVGQDLSSFESHAPAPASPPSLSASTSHPPPQTAAAPIRLEILLNLIVSASSEPICATARALHKFGHLDDAVVVVRPAQLIGFARSVNWSLIDYDTKLVVVHELNTAITAIHEKNGLTPLDDNLPGEPDTPFRVIRAIVLTASPHDEGARRGEARSE